MAPTGRASRAAGSAAAPARPERAPRRPARALHPILQHHRAARRRPAPWASRRPSPMTRSAPTPRAPAPSPSRPPWCGARAVGARAKLAERSRVDLRCRKVPEGRGSASARRETEMSGACSRKFEQRAASPVRRRTFSGVAERFLRCDGAECKTDGESRDSAPFRRATFPDLAALCRSSALDTLSTQKRSDASLCRRVLGPVFVATSCDLCSSLCRAVRGEEGAIAPSAAFAVESSTYALRRRRSAAGQRIASSCCL